MYTLLAQVLLWAPWYLAGVAFLYGLTQCKKSRREIDGWTFRNVGAPLMLWCLFLVLVMYVVGGQLFENDGCTGTIKFPKCEGINELAIALTLGNFFISIIGVPIVLVLAALLHFLSPPTNPPDHERIGRAD